MDGSNLSEDAKKGDGEGKKGSWQIGGWLASTAEYLKKQGEAVAKDLAPELKEFASIVSSDTSSWAQQKAEQWRGGQEGEAEKGGESQTERPTGGDQGCWTEADRVNLARVLPRLKEGNRRMLSSFRSPETLRKAELICEDEKTFLTDPQPSTEWVETWVLNSSRKNEGGDGNRQQLHSLAVSAFHAHYTDFSAHVEYEASEWLHDPVVSHFRSVCVPLKVSEELFWRRFLFRISLLSKPSSPSPSSSTAPFSASHPSTTQVIQLDKETPVSVSASSRGEHEREKETVVASLQSHEINKPSDMQNSPSVQPAPPVTSAPKIADGEKPSDSAHDRSVSSRGSLGGLASPAHPAPPSSSVQPAKGKAGAEEEDEEEEVDWEMATPAANPKSVGGAAATLTPGCAQTYSLSMDPSQPPSSITGGKGTEQPHAQAGASPSADSAAGRLEEGFEVVSVSPSQPKEKEQGGTSPALQQPQPVSSAAPSAAPPGKGSVLSGLAMDATDEDAEWVQWDDEE
uniref:BSD domain-containing protein n=1 Tax=Chromera velia CCMP2878 TaxID=1169474 RepID=A0A0G4GR28_9ALVE|eukprot:Cvel_22995.t1-p1 / transcript=Cvel_22995.t1 / gene=Cvel_22995 / organism=Chromera_velia_CCMP2878 / gene_product=hypothetical protein / transcript_product=hypothetical protein / location=Cvel_scaffold2320:22098-23633(+) / protein_length=512 / sequence_SO=supercontig / SO=protein_coding / is_pseudo=false